MRYNDIYRAELEKHKSIAESDFRLLFFDAFSLDFNSWILKKYDDILSDKEIELFREYLKKREENIPVQYILSRADFYGLEFYVNENVLIPRFDTENLVSEVLKLEGKSVLDMCTGSGAIAVTLKKIGNFNEVVAADISDEALEVARINAKKNDVKINCIQSDMFENINEKYDIIVSNPPYIRTDEIGLLDCEVQKEPYIALDGSCDGLRFYKILADESKNYLNDGGSLFLEIGYDQGEDVSNLLREKGFNDIVIVKDLSGLDRVIAAKK